MRRWLTDTERNALPPPDRRRLRRVRRRAHNLKRWPETDGVPPWLVRGAGYAAKVSRRAAIILGKAATTAVLQAAAAVLSGGQARHEFAVAALLAVAAGEAIELAREDAAGWVEDAYGVLSDEGVGEE